MVELELGIDLGGTLSVEVEKSVLGKIGIILDLGVNRSRAMEWDEAVVVKSGIVSVVTVSSPLSSLMACNAVSIPNRIPDGRRCGLRVTFSISMLRLL